MIPCKPVIGVVGGIGSGKSQVARILAGSGAVWLSADDLAHQAYAAAEVQAALRSLWGEQVFLPDGTLDRHEVARRVFADPGALRRLEAVIHPWIRRRRAEICAVERHRPDLKAFVADSPLLFEANLDFECDVILFVECRLEVRAQRLLAARGWSREELTSRESRQLPLDFKRDRADYIVRNNSDADTLVRQVHEVFARIIGRACA